MSSIEEVQGLKERVILKAEGTIRVVMAMSAHGGRHLLLGWFLMGFREPESMLVLVA